jgi:hypothetical protein
MKKFFTTIVIVLASIFTVSAQNYGYLKTQDILDKMPEYKIAQNQLDKIREGHEANISTEMDRIEMLFKKYQSEKPRLSDNLRQSRENEIILMEKNVKEKQNEIFGQDGSFSKKTIRSYWMIPSAICFEMASLVRSEVVFFTWVSASSRMTSRYRLRNTKIRTMLMISKTKKNRNSARIF